MSVPALERADALFGIPSPRRCIDEDAVTKPTCNDLHEAVRNSYPAPNFTYMREVRDATGFDAVRSADGIAVGMYRSCGRMIHGFEMKVSRSDWQKELSNAAKAESLMRYCHQWSLIVPDASIVKDGELPVTWGLGIPYQSRSNAPVKIKWIVKPPPLEPIAFSMVFLTALIYAASKIDEGDRQKALQDEYDRGLKSARDSFDRQAGMDKLKSLQAAVEAFEQASGISINDYTSEKNANRMGMKFKEWQDSLDSVAQGKKRLDGLLKQAEHCHRAIHNVINITDRPLTWEEREGAS